MLPTLETNAVEKTLTSRIAAFSALRFTPEDIAVRRKAPGNVAGVAVPANFLKNADEQTVAALTATLRAAASLPDEDFSTWGAISAASFFGRRTIARNIRDYPGQGAWGVSPHLIPQTSIHAPTGAITTALHMHGPNIGVGGGASAAADAFALAMSMLSEFSLPGIWLVLTAHEFELVPSETGEVEREPMLETVALALTPLSQTDSRSQEESGLFLRLAIEESEPDAQDKFLEVLPAFRLGDWVDQLLTTTPAGVWKLPELGWVEIETRQDEAGEGRA